VTRRLGNRRAYRGVSWADHALARAHAAHLPVFNAVVRLVPREGPSAMGTWQGRPCSGLRGGTWRRRTPSRGKGGPGPQGQLEWSGPWRSGLHTWWHRTSLGSPGPWRPRQSALPLWARGGAGPIRARGRSGDYDPSCQSRAVCHVAQRTRERLRITLRPSGLTPVRRLTDRLGLRRGRSPRSGLLRPSGR
jgi:hypothetical protein